MSIGDSFEEKRGDQLKKLPQTVVISVATEDGRELKAFKAPNKSGEGNVLI